MAIVESLLFNMPVFILDGVELEPLQLASGLIQVILLLACSTSLVSTPLLLFSATDSSQFQVFQVLLTTGPCMDCHGLPAI